MPILWRLWWLVLVALAALVAFLLSNSPEAAAHVDAQTERLTLYDKERAMPEWDVGGFELKACGRNGAMEQRTLADDSKLAIEPGARVDITRLQGSPLVEIEISMAPIAPRPAATPCQGAPRIAALRTPDGDRRWVSGPWATLSFRHVTASAAGASPSSARLLALSGVVTIGQDFSSAAKSQLLAGQVQVYATVEDAVLARLLEKLKVDQTYLAEVRPLVRGDRLQLVRPNDGEPLAGAGSARIAASGVIDVNVVAGNAEARIHRYGVSPITVAPAFWRRFQNEPALAGAATLLVLWINLATISAIFWPPVAAVARAATVGLKGGGR